MMFIYKQTENLTYRLNTELAPPLFYQLREYQKDGHLCDVQLVAHGHTVQAHRVVLAVRSSYFDAMFTGDFQERWQTTIDLSESVATSHTLSTLINFMYTGEITITSTIVEDILSAASLLMMDDVKKYCAQYFVTNLSPLNCVRIWSLADLYDLKDLAIVCKAMAQSRFMDFIQNRKEILETPGCFVQKLIAEGVLAFLSPVEVVGFLQRWFDYSPETRVVECVGLMTCLKQQQLMGEIPPNMSRFFSMQPNTPEAMTIYLNTMKESLKSQPCSHAKTLKVIASWDGPYNTPVILPAENSGKKPIQMHFYAHGNNRWYNKEFDLPFDLLVLDFIGAIDDTLVFQVNDFEILLCNAKHSPVQWKKAPKKVRRKHDTPFKHCNEWFKIFDGKLFHIIICCCNRRMIIMKVLLLDTFNESWKHCSIIHYKAEDACQLQVYDFITCSTVDALFFLVAVSDQILFGKMWKQPVGIYTLEFEEDTIHLAEVDLQNCTIRQSGDKLMVLPMELGPYGVYDLKSKDWSVKQCHVDLCPPTIKLPLSGRKQPVRLVPVDLDMVVPPASMQTHAYEQGYLCLEVKGPYMCKFWKGAGDLSVPDSFVWSELAPPSTEKLQKFCLTEISSNILDGCELVRYSDCSEDAGKSQLANILLHSHCGHTEYAHSIASSYDYPNSYEDVFSLSNYSMYNDVEEYDEYEEYEEYDVLNPYYKRF